MKTFRRWIFGSMLMACLMTAAACSGEKPTTTSAQVRAAINEELAVGASAADIEGFFKRHDIEFGWNRFNESYEGIIREVAPFHGISIFIYVDDKRQLVRSEVQDSYTAP